MGEEDYKLKMAVIAGASHALRFKEVNPTATDQEIIRQITAEMKKIIKNMDEIV